MDNSSRLRNLDWRIPALSLIAVTLLLAVILNKCGVLRDRTYFGQRIPNPSPAFDFRLTSHTGAPLQLSSLRGKAVLMSFGYTHCPDICPTTLWNFDKIYKSLSPEEQKKLQVLFITVDPDRDNQEQLKGYVPYYNPAFLGLTGTLPEISKVAKAYGAFYKKSLPPTDAQTKDYTVDHSSYAYLIDPDGKLFLIYDYDKLPQTGLIAADISRVLTRAKKSSTAESSF